MPRATLASRTLKNKDTGLDLFVPTYKEIKGLVTNVVHYQVVLVSSLSCFKSPSHKESDVVQYSIEKKYGEFEELRNKVNELFSGTFIPQVLKKSIIVNDQVLRDRRNSLDALLKFLASTKKISTCQPLLEFLGVDLIRAKKFSKGESLDQNQQSTSKAPIKDEEEEEKEKLPDNDFFSEDDEDKTAEDLFTDEIQVKKTGEGAIFDSDGIGVFAGQDLKRELTEEDEAELFLPDDAIISRTQVSEAKTKTEEMFEDNSDLFKIDDDLDQLMKVEISKKPRQPDSKGESSVVTPLSSKSEAKPILAKKPAIPGKPSLPSKPVIPGKPSLPSKPAVPSKEKTSPSKPSSSQQKSEAPVRKEEEKPSNQGSTFANDLGQDDILKYLQAHTDPAEDDLDLFS